MKASKLLLALCIFTSCIGTTCKSQQPTSNNNAASTNMNATDTTPNTAATITHIGALIAPPNPRAKNAINFKQQVARLLNIRYLRDGISLDTPKAHTLLESDFHIIMNINSTAFRMGNRYPFPTDTVAYKQRLSAVIASFPKKPALIAIENEANAPAFYAGPAKDYINLLKAAIGVVHSYGIPVTDAGTTSNAVKYLLYQDYLHKGMRQEAEALKQKLNPQMLPRIIKSAQFADTVLTALRTLPVDYVNMHWYQNTTDTQDLEAAVNYLKQRTGKEVISNEMGQSDKPDADVVAAMLRKCRQLKMPYVIWYSGNSAVGERARALQTESGTLDANGEAFKKSL